MKQSAIARFEGGTTAPSIETILKIAIALGVQMHFTNTLIGNEEAAAAMIEEEVFA
ncbi:helix-turn-helix transcriptional regulator [Paenibacillus sp. OV219]|uniref:helix-turn-helix domain-containing protein n=1 Tax=Paenibacillus sp. OV219 TaxID=1884377 RepID=UPI000B81ED8C|nr:helix-turn-helix transcriptional regulator [Paenibacillus sp. OV219]